MSPEDAIDPSQAPDEQWQHAVEANVRGTVRQLGAAPGGHAAVTEGRIEIVGAIYELGSACVRFLEEEGVHA